jgi:polyhydroxyalkanoate synthesis regulator phasin
MTDQAKMGSWRDLLEKTIELGLGAALLTKEAAGQLVDDLVKRGAVTKEDGKKLVAEMLEKGKGQKEKMDQFVAEVVDRMLKKADLARQSTVAELERRLAALEERLRQTPGD